MSLQLVTVKVVDNTGFGHDGVLHEGSEASDVVVCGNLGFVVDVVSCNFDLPTSVGSLPSFVARQVAHKGVLPAVSGTEGQVTGRGRGHQGL